MSDIAFGNNPKRISAKIVLWIFCETVKWEKAKNPSTGGTHMKLREIAERLGWELKTPKVLLEGEVKTGYASDLLSDVLAHSIEGDLWVTRQTHLNIVAIAVMRDLAGILLVSGAEPDADTVEKALEKAVPIFRTPLPTFEAVGRLYQIGISGKR
jgi:hypothetical protein